jgi:hypothetical protein
MAQLLRQFNGNEVAALIGYNAGPKTAERFLRAGSDPSVLPAETREYIKAILTPPPGGEQMVKAESDRAAALELERKNLEANNRLYGQNGKALETTIAVNQRLSEEQQKGVTITESYAAAIRKSEAEKAALAQQMATTRYGRDAAFEREQLGRPASEQSAYSRARSVVGDTTSPAAQFIIEQETMTANMRELRSEATNALGGFASDLARGSTAMQALANQTTRWADKLLNLAADQAVSALFRGFLGSGGGGSGGLVEGLQSLNLASLFGQSPLPTFAAGGISNGPSIFGEAGPEAAVPLPDGRRIPVHISQPANSNASGEGSTVLSPSFAVSIQATGSSGDAAMDRRNAEANAKAAMEQAEVMWVKFASKHMRPGGVVYEGGTRRSNA